METRPVARKVPRYAVILVVAGGAVALLANLLNAITQIVTGIPVAGTSGANGIQGYPPHAISDLLWAGWIVNTFGAAVAILAILIGLTAFRRGERWAWYAIWVVVASGALNALFDGLQAGPFVAFTFVFFGLLPFLGVILSARAFFTKEPSGAASTPGQTQGPPAG
jgi:hypothetical protein